MDQELKDIYTWYRQIHKMYENYSLVTDDARDIMNADADALALYIEEKETDIDFTIQLSTFGKSGATLEVYYLENTTTNGIPERRKSSGVTVYCRRPLFINTGEFATSYNWSAWGSVSAEELLRFQKMLAIALECGQHMKTDLEATYPVKL